MHIDKPMKEHNLMQTIALVKRMFKDKIGSLALDTLESLIG